MTAKEVPPNEGPSARLSRVRASRSCRWGTVPRRGLVVVESPAVGEKYLPKPDKRLRAGRFETADVGTWLVARSPSCDVSIE